MGNYLNQFQRLSQSMSQSTREGVSRGTQYINEAARYRAANAQKAAAERRKQEQDLFKKMYGEEAKPMYKWMTDDINAEKNALMMDFQSGISDEEMMMRIQSIQTAATEYNGIYEAQMGDPDDASNSGTYYGNLNAATQYATTDVNPYEDVDMIPADFLEGEEGLANYSNKREERLAVFGSGVSERDQYIKGGIDATTGQWMVTMGDPADQNSWKTMPRGDIYKNTPKNMAFMPDLTDINFKDMRELATDPTVRNYVGDSPNVDQVLTRYFNSNIAMDKKGRKNIFEQYGVNYVGEEKSERDRFIDPSIIPVNYDKMTADLEIAEVADMAYGNMIGQARTDFIAAYKSAEQDRNKKAASGRSQEVINPDNIRAEEFVAQTAADDINNRLPNFNIAAGDMEFIEDKGLSSLEKVMYSSNTGDAVSGVAIIPDGRHKEKVVALKIMEETRTRPTIDEATQEQYRLADLPIPTEEYTVQMPYYDILTVEETSNVFKTIGKQLGYKTNWEAEGKKFLYKKYEIN